MKSYVKPALFVLVNLVFNVAVGYYVSPWLGIAFAVIDAVVLIYLANATIKKLTDERAEFIDYINELLGELEEQAKEPAEVRGARLAVEGSGAITFANAWLSAMPEDTIRDFVVKFDGWREEDWTMWVRLPWGKYQEHKAEIDFAVGRNVMKEAERKDESNGN